MNNRTAKAFARIRSYNRPAGSEDGTLEIVVEFTLLGGAPRSGYFAVTPLPIVNERDLADDIRSALAGELSQRYAPENYRPRDIVLAGL